MSHGLREWWHRATNVLRMRIALGEPKYGSDEDEWRERVLALVGEPPVNDERLEGAIRERDEARDALDAFYEVASAYMTAVRRGDTKEAKAETGKAMYEALFYAQKPRNSLLIMKLRALGEEAKLRKAVQ